MYELKYVEGMKPVVIPEALATGKKYHQIIDDLNNGIMPDTVDFSKERAMAQAYYKYIFPKFHVVESEKWLEYDLLDGDKLVGIADGIAEDGHIVEHKTTGSEITEQYEYNLQWDEQILAYMLMTGKRKVWYTVCRKPTIRQKQNESDEEFYQRMVEWYDTDTDSKIRLLEIFRTDDEVLQFEDDLLMLIRSMKSDVNYYRNTCHCNQYGRRCEYSSICLHYDPNAEYIDFVKEEEEYAVEKG
jgi:hypothetical protein